MLSSKLNVLSHNSIPSCQIWKIPSQAGVVVLQKLFWVSIILCYLQNWTLGPKTLFSVARCEKFLQTGIAFIRQSFWVQTTICYLQNRMFCPITPFQVVRFEKSLHKQGLLFCRLLFWVSTILCYLQNWTFHNISVSQ